MKRFLTLLVALCMTLPAYAQKWHEGGTLQGATVIAWAMSSDENALASSAEYIKDSTETGALSTAILTGDFKRAAEEVAVCMKQFADAAQKPVTREDATPYVMSCMEKAQANHPWLSPNQPAKDKNKSQSTNEAWDTSEAIPVSYIVYEATWDHKKAIQRSKLNIRLIPAKYDKNGELALDSVASASREQLAATVIAAAKYYAKDTGATSISVVLDSLPDVDSGACQLAVADYAPDGKGISGKDNWTWKGVQAADKTFSDQEVTMQQLWGELRGKYKTPQGSLDEDALSQAIAERMGIPVSQVNLPFRILVDVPAEFVNAVKPLPGLKSMRK